MAFGFGQLIKGTLGLSSVSILTQSLNVGPCKANSSRFALLAVMVLVRIDSRIDSGLSIRSKSKLTTPVSGGGQLLVRQNIDFDQTRFLTVVRDQLPVVW